MTSTRISGRQWKMPHGTFYSLTTQRIANTAATQAIALEVDDDVHQLTHDTVTNNSRIYATLNGSYLVAISGIADLAALPGDKHLEVWLAKGGVDIADSNTRVQIVAATTEITVAVCFIIDLDDGEYFELMTWGDDTDCGWLATAAAAGPTRPAVPSMVVTVNMVNGY